jgi:hypothetical protein
MMFSRRVNFCLFVTALHRFARDNLYIFFDVELGWQIAFTAKEVENSFLLLF